MLQPDSVRTQGKIEMAKIKFLPADIEVDVREGTTILDAALDANVNINHNCGGNCACSTCHVFIEEGLQTLKPMTEDEEDMLDEAEGLTDRSRLACQCKVTADLVVKIPPAPTTLDDDTF
jgi:2Fe-2S ferredoxin